MRCHRTTANKPGRISASHAIKGYFPLIRLSSDFVVNAQNDALLHGGAAFSVYPRSDFKQSNFQMEGIPFSYTVLDELVYGAQ